MKQIVFACIAFLVLGSCNGKKKIPVNVITAFSTKYPTAKDAEWEIDDEEYEVEFELDGNEMTAVFLKKGSWVETENEIEKKDIPVNIKEAISLKYADYEIDEAEMIENMDMKGYEIALKKGKEKMEVVYTMDGTFVKQKVKKNDDDDNDDDEKKEKDGNAKN